MRQKEVCTSPSTGRVSCIYKDCLHALNWQGKKVCGTFPPWDIQWPDKQNKTICKCFRQRPPSLPDGSCSRYTKRWKYEIRSFGVGDEVICIYHPDAELGVVTDTELLPSGTKRYWVRSNRTGAIFDYFGDELILASTPMEDWPYWLQGQTILVPP